MHSGYILLRFEPPFGTGRHRVEGGGLGGHQGAISGGLRGALAWGLHTSSWQTEIPLRCLLRIELRGLGHLNMYVCQSEHKLFASVSL